MKKLISQGALLFGVTGTALAAGAVESGGSGLMIALFLGFVSVIVVFQMIPSLILFFLVVKEIVTGRPRAAARVVERDEAG